MQKLPLSIKIAIGLGVLLLILLWVQRSTPIFTYLFFARYSLFTGLILVGLPLLSVTAASNVGRNLFVLHAWWDVALVTWFAILLSWVMMSTLRLTWHTLPEIGITAAPLPLPIWPEWAIAAAFSLAALPMVAVTILQSHKAASWRSWLGLIIGVVVTFLARAAADSYLIPFIHQPWLSWLRSGLDWLFIHLLHYGPAGEHEGALAYFLLTLILYVSGFWLLRPGRGWLQIPALCYFLLWFMLLGWLLPGIALFLDRYHISPLLVLTAISYLCWALTSTDYYYSVQPKATVPDEPAPERLTSITAFERWHALHPMEQFPVMTVVTASGGGIKAAYWTASVLAKLQEEFGERFGQSILLISSASGGSVGSMYFVDGYSAAGAPDAAQLRKIVNAARSPSLAETAWGIIYPDFWRVFFPFPIVSNRLLDRGWALEQTWAQRLTKARTTLADWKTGIAAGWRPTTFFNATVVETGEQFVLTPLDNQIQANGLPVSGEAKYFSGLYPQYDLDVATAARLSAAFPYVSPGARAINTPGIRDYHLVDGGYYDNYGVVSALNWLKQVMPTAVARNRHKLLIIQIQSAPFDENKFPPPNDYAGWLYSLAGPLITFLNVQGTAQQQRNSMEFQIFESAHRDDLNIKRVKFELSQSVSLSWQLAPDEIGRVQRDLSNEHHTQVLEEIRRFLA